MSNRETSLMSITGSEVERIRDDVYYSYILALERILADTSYIPDKDSYEFTIKEMLSRVKGAQFAEMRNRFTTLYNAPIDVRRFIYKDYANIDHKNALCIRREIEKFSNQRKKILQKLKADKSMSFEQKLRFFLGSSPNCVFVNQTKKTRNRNTSPIIEEYYPNADIEKLSIFIESVKCLDETNTNVGSDEIWLGGVSVDEDGTTKKIKAIEIHDDFDTGEEKVFNPPFEWTWFSLHESTGLWPRNYFVTFLLFEKDAGGMGDFLNKFCSQLAIEVGKEIQKAFNKIADSDNTRSVVGGIAVTVLAAAIGSAVKTVISMAGSWLSGKAKDDVFEPRTDKQIIDSLDSMWTWWSNGHGYRRSETCIRDFIDLRGHYHIKYYWQRSTNEKKLRELAYIAWKNRNCPQGDDWTDWFNAKKYVGLE